MDDPKAVDYYHKLMAGEHVQYRLIAGKALSLKPDAVEIADIGTGPGFLAIELAKMSRKQIKAIDVSPNMLLKSQELAEKANVEIETVESSCENLPFADQSLDLVTSIHLLHVLADPLPYFMELKRVLKPGGRALIIDFRRDTWGALRLAGDLHTRLSSARKPIESLGTVLDASFTKDELTVLFRKAGFDSFTVKNGILSLQAILRPYR